MAVGEHPLSRILKDLIVANNILLLSAPWIASPSKPPIGQKPRPGLHPIIAASAYALAQPIYLAAQAWTGIPMWICLLAISPQHCPFADFILTYWDIKSKRNAREPDLKEKLDAEAIETRGSWLDPIKDLRKLEIFSWLMPIQTAAASDAALVLLGAEMYSYPEAYSYSSNKANFFFAFFALALYLGSRIVDYRIAVVTQQRGFFDLASYTWTERAVFLGLLVYLFVVRSGVGWVVSQWSDQPVLSMTVLPRNVEIVLDRSRMDGLLKDSETRSWWVSPLMTWVSIPLQFLGVYLLRTAAMED